MNYRFTNTRGAGSSLAVAFLLCYATVLAQPAQDGPKPAAARSEVAPRLAHIEKAEVRVLDPTSPGAGRNTQAGQAKLRMADFDTTTLEAEDRIWEEVPGRPLRTGVNRQLPAGPISCASAGEWSTLPDGTRLWTFDLEVPNAKAVRVHFNEFDLPGSTQLLLYGDGIGRPDVYRSRGPVGKGQFWAAAVSGEVVHLQYQAPSGVEGRPAITFDEISHIYNRPSPDDLLARVKDNDAQDGGGYSPMWLDCEQDVNCCEPQNEDCPYAVDTTARDAVGAIEFVSGGNTSYCSGALLADNDPNTYAGYFLTANHCLHTQGVVDTMTVYWFYQTFECNGAFPPQYWVPKSIGGTLLATSTTTDFTFIRLLDDPHEGQGFAAWTEDPPSGTVYGIHHPGNSLKRISIGALTTDPPICGDRPLLDYWYLDWTTGVTEGGSSGSPLFNGNWQVVGQLYGWCGEAPNCGNPEASNTLYGRFGGPNGTYDSISYWLTNLVASDDGYEDNDTLAQAATITSGSYNLRLVDFDDYFSVVTLAAGQLSATATYSAAAMIPRLQLLQTDGALIAESAIGGGTETVSANLPAGAYVIRFAKEHKWGGNYAMTVTLPGYSDFDLDGDVDMVDFAHLQRCCAGSATQTNPNCFDADLNDDDRVDAADLALFDACYSGPNVHAQAGCTP